MSPNCSALRDNVASLICRGRSVRDGAQGWAHSLCVSGTCCPERGHRLRDWALCIPERKHLPQFPTPRRSIFPFQPITLLHTMAPPGNGVHTAGASGSAWDHLRCSSWPCTLGVSLREKCELQSAYICVSVCVYAHMYQYVYLRICMFVYMCVCACMRVCVSNTTLRWASWARAQPRPGTRHPWSLLTCREA